VSLQKPKSGLIRTPIEIKHWEDLEPKRKANLKIGIWEGVFAQTHIVLVCGKFLTGFALRLGANAFHFGLLNALPFLMQPANIISSYLSNKIGHRKPIVLAGVFLARFIWFAVIPLVFLKPVFGERVILIFLFFYAIMAFGGAITGSAWTMWMDNLVPLKLRGRYFGLRSAILSVLTIIVDYIASQTRDSFARAGHEDIFYAVLFSIAVLAAGIDLYFLNKQWEPPWKPAPSPHFIRLMKEFFQNKNFFTLTRAFLLWNLGLGISSAFFSVHMLTYLQMSFVKIWIYTLIVLTTGLLFNFIWGHLMDKAGTRAVLLSNAFIISIIPLFWLIPTQRDLTFIYIDAFFTGLCWTGFNLASFNIPLVLAPQKNRPFFVSTFLSISGLAFGFGSILGGVIAYQLRFFNVIIWGHIFINYHILFLLSAILRSIGALQFSYIRDVESKGVIYLFQMMGSGLQKSFFIVRDFIFAPKNELPVIKR